MRGLRGLSLLALTLMIGGVIAACNDDNETAADDGTATAVYADVGVVLSLSGPNAAYGSPTRAGMELAIADLEDGELESDATIAAAFLDDEGDAGTGAERFAEHVEDDVTAILGPTLSNTAFDAHPVAQDAGVPVVAVTNTAAGITDTGDYIFRVSLAEDAVIPQTVEAIANEWSPSTAALVFSGDDAWSRSSADSFREAAGEHGIEIIIEQDVPSDGDDFSDAVAAIGDANPDVILLTALEHASAEVVLEVRAQGLEQRVACGNGCNTGTFIEATGDASEGLVVGSAWHVDSENEQSAGFVERYREMHDADPDQFSAQGYAGIQVLAEAISRAGTNEPEAVRDELAGIHDFETVLGTFSFDDDRNGHHPAVIKIVEGGEFVIFQ